TLLSDAASVACSHQRCCYSNCSILPLSHGTGVPLTWLRSEFGGSDIVWAMSGAVVLAPEVHHLAERLALLLGDQQFGATATMAVARRAPDERLALASLLKLAEESRAELSAALQDAASAEDLALCLGGSEVVAQGLGAMGTAWLDFFREARRSTVESSN